jgi:hypothetical protein
LIPFCGSISSRVCANSVWPAISQLSFISHSLRLSPMTCHYNNGDSHTMHNQDMKRNVHNTEKLKGGDEHNFQEENLDRYLQIGDHHVKHARHRTDQYSVVTNLDKHQTKGSPNTTTHHPTTRRSHTNYI